MNVLHPPNLFVMNLWRAAIVLALAIFAVIGCKLMGPLAVEPEAGVELTLPENVPGYFSKEGEISEGERVILPPDTGFARRIYTDASGENILASIILSGAERRSIHRPEACLPSQGWRITSSETVDISMNDGKKLPVMKLRVVKQIRLPNGQSKELVSYIFYFFVGKNVVTPSHYSRVFITSYDRVTKHTNHRWAYVLIQGLVTEGLKPNGKSEKQTVSMMERLTADIVPTFLKVPLK